MKWGVIVPIAGHQYVEVEASGEEEAIDLAVETAFDSLNIEGLEGELEAYHRLFRGNVSHVSCSEASAELIEDLNES